MNIVERFLQYVAFDTQSAEDTGKTPSTDKQFNLARFLKNELEALGLEDVEMTDNGCVYATLPANTSDDVPVIGFIAHMDTSPDASGENVKPRQIAYAGGDIVRGGATVILAMGDGKRAAQALAQKFGI